MRWGFGVAALVLPPLFGPAAAVLARGPSRRKPVQWFHVHKAGGTTICTLAQVMGERLIKPMSNCNNPEFQDSYQQRNEQLHLNCTERLAAFEMQHATWSAFEVPLEEGSNFCPGDFYYATAVREPMDRLESHLGFQLPFDESYLELPCRYDVLIAHLAASNVTEELRRACRPQLATFDNYFVRMLGGREVARLPVGSVSQQHFEKARAVLERFDLVLPVEVLASDERAALDLNREFGWSLLPEHARLRFRWEGFKKVMRKERPEHKVRLSDEQLRYLRYLNRFDIALHNMSTVRYRSRLAALSH